MEGTPSNVNNDSMTEVTEDDGSLTESSMSEVNLDESTEDKLTPSLNNISISKGAPSKVNKLSSMREGRGSSCPGPDVCHTLSQDKKRHRKNYSESSFKSNNNTVKTQLDYNTSFTCDIPGNNNTFYTDFSMNDDSTLQINDGYRSHDENKRQFLPDMTSPFWFKAKVFNNYWSHYQFVMKWYHEHVNFLHNILPGYPGGLIPSQFPQKKLHKKTRSRSKTNWRKFKSK